MTGFDLRDVIDIGLVAAGLWAIVVWLRRARAGLAALGALTLTAVYLAARELRLELTAWMFQGFFAVFLIIVIVILQNDLRRTFERIARWSFRRNGRRGIEPQTVRVLARTAFELADRNWGALLVVPGRDLVDRHVEGGYPLSGNLSPALLISLFDPGSPGHDGAAIVEGGDVSRFGVHLPLSSNFSEIRERGTRHSAALGLSEVTDALCVVASEERGEVAIARQGRLQSIDTADALEAVVLEHMESVSPQARSSRRFPPAIRRYGPEAAVSLALSIGLWWFFVSGHELSERTFRVPVQIENIHPDYEIESVEPQEVEVVLEGEVRDLFLLDPTELRVRVEASSVELGRRTFRLSEGAVRHPERLTVGGISPETVVVRVRQIEAAPEPDRPPGASRTTSPSPRTAVSIASGEPCSFTGYPCSQRTLRIPPGD